MAGKRETTTEKTTPAAAKQPKKTESEVVSASLINDVVISDSEDSELQNKPINSSIRKNKPEPKKPESEPDSESEDEVEDTGGEEEADVEDSAGEEHEEEDEEVEEENVKKKIEKSNSGNKLNGKMSHTKAKGKGKEKEIEKGESGEYKLPMRRISRIIKDGDPDIRMGHEATFLINKATEKFMELFAKEAYACAYLDRKNQIAYNHLSSVVAKRNKFDFLADIVPAKVRAEDALARLSTNEK